MCKDCKREHQRDRLDNPEASARHRHLCELWRVHHPEKRREMAARSRAKPRTKMVEAAHARLRREHFAEALAARDARAGAVKRGATVAETVSPLVVLELHDGVCGICGEDVDPFDFEADHIVPLVAGGFHTCENLQPAHPRCNRAKATTERRAA